MDIDLLIFSTFLALSLVLGILSSRRITNISEYAIGNRDFSTATIVATIVATWIGAGFFARNIIEVYRQGIYYLIPTVFNPLALFLIGHIFAPRMGEFLGKLSIAQVMGELFGSKVRLMTVIFSLIRSICYLAVNFKVSAKVLEVIFGTSAEYATIMSAFIVITYSTLGGIRAVTFTDLIQFFTFGCLMPVIAIIAWRALGENSGVIVWNTLTTNPLFDYKVALDLGSYKFYQMLGLGLFFLIPKFGSEMFQRISMSRSVGQVVSAFKIAGLLLFLVQMVVIAIGIFILSDNPNLNPDNLVSYVVSHYSYAVGFKGMISIGIMAMMMSTADSSINSIAVIFAHDFCKPLGFKWAKNELLVARVAAVVSSMIAMLLALRIQSILNLVVSFSGLYLPVVSIPFLFAIFGFRSSGKSVLVAMGGSIITILLWRLFFAKAAIDSLIPSIFASTFFLFGMHYVTKQSGGWIGIKDEKTYKAIKQMRNRKWQKLWRSIVEFDFYEFCAKNTPEKIQPYFYFGLLGILSAILTMISMPSVSKGYGSIMEFCYISVLTVACYLLTYPLWPARFHNPKFVSLFWISSIFYINIFVNSIFLAISEGSQIQTTIFFLNLTAVLLVCRWQAAVFMLLSGFVAANLFITQYMQLDYSNLMSVKFYFMFCLLLISSILIAFLRPIQEHQDQKAALLIAQNKEIQNISQQLLNHMIIRQEFINNVNHEIRTPIHHVGAYLEDLDECWYRDSPHDKRESFELLKQGYQRIRRYMEDILDLSNLSSNKVKLRYETVDFQNLVSEIVDQFPGIDVKNKDLHFYFDCRAKEIMVSCDKEKINQVLINLIKNAIEFTSKGTIEVVLSNEDVLVGRKRLSGIKCSITDEGVGIPEEELWEIFGPFIQSSRTKNMSGGKGLGLAISEHIINLHHGRIFAKNNNDKPGATFYFVIPLSLEV